MFYYSGPQQWTALEKEQVIAGRRPDWIWDVYCFCGIEAEADERWALNSFARPKDVLFFEQFLSFIRADKIPNKRGLRASPNMLLFRFIQCISKTHFDPLNLNFKSLKSGTYVGICDCIFFYLFMIFWCDNGSCMSSIVPPRGNKSTSRQEKSFWPLKKLVVMWDQNPTRNMTIGGHAIVQ